MLFTYTNEGDATRVYQDFELKPKPGHKLYRVATNENPVATRTGFFDLQRGLLGADEAEQYLMGHAMHVGEGKAFPKFDRAVHVKPTPYSKHLHLCWCLDFNVSPFCTGVTQSENGDVFVIAEIEKKDNGHTAEMCEIFFDRAKELGWNLDGLHIYGDPSGDHRETVADKNHTDWRIVRNALDSRKINYKWCVPLSHSDRLSTVNAVRAKLRSADGKVRASIDPSCEGIINDLMTAEWPSDLTENHRLAWLRYYINREWPIRIEAGRPTGGVVGFSKGFTPATTRPTSGAVGLSAGFGPMLGRPR